MKSIWFLLLMILCLPHLVLLIHKIIVLHSNNNTASNDNVVHPMGYLISKTADHTFVINLDQRVDRLNHTIDQLENIGLDYNHQFERFSAIHVGRAPPCFRNESVDKDPNDLERYRSRAYSTMKSHVEVIRLAMQRNYQTVLILEDDNIFESTVNWTIVNKLIDHIRGQQWQMIFFTLNTPDQSTGIQVGLQRVTRGFMANAYLVHSSLYAIILDQAERSGLEIDVFYSQSILPLYNCYRTVPRLAYQKRDFSDTLNRLVDYTRLG